MKCVQLVGSASWTVPSSEAVVSTSAEQATGTETEAREAIKLVVELGADVNDVDETGNTTLHGAATKVVLRVSALPSEVIR